ncbi:hypothetical protein BpHYR1_006308 [Brachionus plicatilis]|uniref:Uncharacterized protein n=1 Tax=Brachionus plicatilis TaxID=10195 RepID=A0A3M7RLZ0_BRAPC|nr:hypothetical protein BpHYR1_006308 [Brachionus plicatilis]
MHKSFVQKKIFTLIQKSINSDMRKHLIEEKKISKSKNLKKFSFKNMLGGGQNKAATLAARPAAKSLTAGQMYGQF